MRPVPLRALFAAAMTVCLAGAPAWAKTIVLTDADCEMMAVINSDAPRMSWASYPNAAAEYGNHMIYLTNKSSFLIRYPLDTIPAGQRITKAEWTAPFASVAPATGAKMQVRRILQEWGPGVSHQFRMIRPKRLEWHTPGAAGVGQDRSVKATATGVLKGVGEHAFNVTEDVELWYSGTVPNYGWLFTVDDPLAYVSMQSPFWNGAKGWKLRITYEPQ